MASSQQLSEYFASFGFKLDMRSVAGVKKQVTQVKQMLERNLQLTLVITKVKLGSKRQLNNDIKSQLEGMGDITLKINSFKVNVQALRDAVHAAYGAGVTLNVNAKGGKQALKDAATPRTPKTSGSALDRTMRDSRFNNIPRVLDRLGAGVGTMATGMGLWEMNKISEDLQTSKVALGTITNGRGDEAYNWLKERGKERGFDYGDQLPVFSSYMASSINKQGYEGAISSFGKLTDYGLTHGADKEGMKRAMTAIGQMWSKGQIHQEELKSQLSEAKGFAGAREDFALAWQDKTGGKLVGQEAEAALIDAMQKGLVKSAEVLPLVIERMAIKAAGGIEAYKKTTTYAHGKFDTYFKESIEMFGKGGFDEGMRNFFLTLAKHMEDNREGILKLGKAFKYGIQVLLSFLDTGIKLLKMVGDMNQSFAGLTLIAYPLLKIFGKWGIILSGLMLIIEDVKVYLAGGKSLIGEFIGYMETLVGFNLDPLAAAFGAIGVAIAAAFSPLAAAILMISALVEMYQRMQKAKAKDAAKDGYSNLTGEAPTQAEINAYGNIGLAKSASKPNLPWYSRLGANVNYARAQTEDFFGIPRPLDKSGKLSGILDRATNMHLISGEDSSHYLQAFSAKMMTEDEIYKQLIAKERAGTRLQQNIEATAAQAAPISLTLNIDGAETARTFEFNLDWAKRQFTQTPTPPTQK